MIIRRGTKTGSNDLNVVYRPCKVDEMLGNKTNKKLIKNACLLYLCHTDAVIFNY